jgi:hypothetical protein
MSREDFVQADQKVIRYTIQEWELKRQALRPGSKEPLSAARGFLENRVADRSSDREFVQTSRGVLAFKRQVNRYSIKAT